MKSLFGVTLGILALLVACQPREDLSTSGASPSPGGSAPAAPQLVLSASPVPLPPGAGQAIALGKCTICHNQEMITQQRLQPGQWGKEVDKMIGWGAPVTPAEKPTLVGYLARHFGVESPPSPPGAGSLARAR